MIECRIEAADIGTRSSSPVAAIEFAHAAPWNRPNRHQRDACHGRAANAGIVDRRSSRLIAARVRITPVTAATYGVGDRWLLAEGAALHRLRQIERSFEPERHDRHHQRTDVADRPNRNPRAACASRTSLKDTSVCGKKLNPMTAATPPTRVMGEPIAARRRGRLPSAKIAAATIERQDRGADETPYSSALPVISPPITGCDSEMGQHIVSSVRGQQVERDGHAGHDCADLDHESPDPTCGPSPGSARTRRSQRAGPTSDRGDCGSTIDVSATAPPQTIQTTELPLLFMFRLAVCAAAQRAAHEHDASTPAPNQTYGALLPAGCSRV